MYCEGSDVAYGASAPLNTTLRDTVNWDYVRDYDTLTGVPNEDSILIGNGDKWWADGPHPIGFDGEPFSDFDTDIAGMQTKRGNFHPSNL